MLSYKLWYKCRINGGEMHCINRVLAGPEGQCRTNRGRLNRIPLYTNVYVVVLMLFCCFFSILLAFFLIASFSICSFWAAALMETRGDEDL